MLYTSTLTFEPSPLSCALGSSLNHEPSLLPCVTPRVHIGLPSAPLGALHSERPTISNSLRTTPPQKQEETSSSLYKFITQWSCLIRETWEAQKGQEKCGPQTAPQPSLLPHILLSRHNRDYQWPPKLLQGPLQAKPNMRVLENPYLLKDPNEDLDPFLPELTEWDSQMKDKSAPALSMLFKGASRTGEDPQMTTMTMMDKDHQKEDLPTKSPMATCRIMSPSPWLSKSAPWDPYPGSLTEINPKLRPSSPNSLDT